MDDLPPSARDDLPNARWLQALTVLLYVGFCGVTYWLLTHSDDRQTQGILIGAWITMTSGAVSFWIGSSSGGKRK